MKNGTDQDAPTSSTALNATIFPGDDIDIQIKIGVFANGELIETISTNFNGPRVRTK